MKAVPLKNEPPRMMFNVCLGEDYTFIYFDDSGFGMTFTAAKRKAIKYLKHRKDRYAQCIREIKATNLRKFKKSEPEKRK